MIQMETMNFTCKEKIQSLLANECTQTMRKAWKENNKIGAQVMPRTMDKPAKFKVGQEVILRWDNESDYKGYCQTCGTGRNNPPMNKCPQCGYNTCFFFGHIGRVRIIEVFKIKLENTPFGRTMSKNGATCDVDAIAKLDGFSSAEDMFKYFDEKYDLSKPREFHVYNWEWL